MVGRRERVFELRRVVLHDALDREVESVERLITGGSCYEPGRLSIAAGRCRLDRAVRVAVTLPANEHLGGGGALARRIGQPRRVEQQPLAGDRLTVADLLRVGRRDVARREGAHALLERLERADRAGT